MNTSVLKSELHDKIEHADDQQLLAFYGLIENYLGSQVEVEEWHTLPEKQKQRLNESLKQAEAGLADPVEEVIEKLRKKHGLDG